MKYLFIVHTPYHLILSMAIRKRYNEKCEILIYNDFNIDYIDLDLLKNVFDNIYMYQTKTINNIKISKFKNIINQKLKIYNMKRLVNNKRYNKIFVFNEGFIETQYLINNNLIKSNSEVIYIEDGSNAYMQISYKDRLKKFKEIMKSILFGFKYEQIYPTFGTHSKVSKRIVLWPQILKKELLNDNKKIDEIKKEELELGLDLYYKKINKNIKINEKMVLILLEHIDFFNLNKNVNIQIYKKVIKKVISMCNENNIDVYIKYHPRDTSLYLDDINLKNIKYIENSIAAEVYYNNKNIMVVSIFSTTLLTAAKLISPKNIISLADIMDMSENNLRDSFYKIGINVPKNEHELQSVIEKYIQS